MLIAQLTDFHCTSAGALAYGAFDTVALLSRAVDAVRRLEPVPDLVIATGDLTQNGTDAEYAEVVTRLEPLRMPVLPVLGNHDLRDAFLRAFPGEKHRDPNGFVQFVHDLPGLRVIVLDTVVERAQDPEFGPDRAVWLAEAIASSVDPVLLVTHHPPIASGITWMDPKDANWHVHLGQVLDSNPGKVIRIISGHLHRPIQGRWQGIDCSTCPSTAFQLGLDLGGTKPRLSMEGAGMQLHRWTGDDLITYGAAIEGLHEHLPAVSAPS